METPKAFLSPAAEGGEKSPSMTEAQTMAYLAKEGVQPLEHWKPHTSFLYVMEEATRGDDGYFKDLPLEQRPSIARLDDPTEIDFSDPRDRGDGTVVYYVGNEGGQVDYYAINPTTNEVTRVKKTNPVKNRENAYFVRKEALFATADHLFPKGI